VPSGDMGNYLILVWL